MMSPWSPIIIVHSRIFSSGLIVLTQLRKIVPGISCPTAPDQERPVEDEFEHLNVQDVKHFVIGCAYGIFTAITNSLLYNIIKQTARPNFDAPSFVIWFRSLFRIFAFPIYALIRWAYCKARRTHRPEDTLSAIVRDGGKIYGDKPVTLRKFVSDMLFLTILSILSQWLNYAPLFAVRGPGNMASMATINLSVVFVLCIVFLKISVMSAKVILLWSIKRRVSRYRVLFCSYLE
ncbi:hypothetical protein RvY_14610 [Ramazzottius varieornatus]|uniref:Uncharacterized protein n=1 Tax=Ramazzottius varieornatus TaxID=947166 RepID=A0A1D1W0C2_RAMVA|nr:hypothetical protein RvY_14610 [Ramazzottius varieornatus]